MRLLPFHCACLVLLLNFACSGRVLRKIKEHVHMYQYQRTKEHLFLRAVTEHRSLPKIRHGRIHQPLDHFNIQCEETISQRFFVNEEYWDRSHGPVFLYIGGEGAILEFNVLAGHHVEIAEKHRALLVTLEHRFYGESIIPNGLDTENLRYLSSQQALSDLVAFHKYISEHYGLSLKNIWISFGGSYAGALSAWLRGKFPHLIYGAVASSAPVKAKLDFSTYNRVVGESLINEDVGGSDKCVKAVSEAFAAVELALLVGNVTEVGKDFGCCQPPAESKDQTELMKSLADIIMGTVQYNQEGGPLTIAKLCDIMTNKSEEFAQEEEKTYDRLVRLAAIYRALEEESCFDISRDRDFLELSNTNLTISIVGQRQWYYQTCTEFGFYETCEDAACPFSPMITLQSQTELCPLVFGITQSSLPSHIHFTNQYYGATNPQTHRVLYVNGDIDPWHDLSVLHNGMQEDRQRAILIKGSAHCADMNPATSVDSPALKQARQEIKDHVAFWLKSAASE